MGAKRRRGMAATQNRTETSLSSTAIPAESSNEGEKRRKVVGGVLDGDGLVQVESRTRARGRDRSEDDNKVDVQVEDEFQQVSQPEFVTQYRVNLGYGADVYYHPSFIPPSLANEWMHEILELDTYQPLLKMYGRTFPQSRQIAAYSTTPNARLKYSGSEITMHHPFPPALERIRNQLERELGVRFNHVMLNRYDDGDVYIGRHSDNLNNLVIASVSLGAERTFIMSPRLPSRSGKGSRKPVSGARSGAVASSAPPAEATEAEAEADLGQRENVKWVLANGSLVVMQGRTQEFWKHEIPKEPRVKDCRISLTFRQLV